MLTWQHSPAKPIVTVLHFFCSPALLLYLPQRVGTEGAQKLSRSRLGSPLQGDRSSSLGKALLCSINFYVMLSFLMAHSGCIGEGAEFRWPENGPKRPCGRRRVALPRQAAACARASPWACARQPRPCTRANASPSVSSPRPVFSEPFGNLVSQPASPGLLWQRLTLKNQSCLYL